MTGRPRRNPFAALGLDAAADLTDDDVRAAWRRVATVTHPDRADGGDPERFAVAAAAYTELRTGYGRGEARATLAGAVGDAAGAAPFAAILAGRRARRAVAAAPAMVRRGRPVRLAVRMAAAGSAATLGALAAGPGPARPALVTGAVTWLLVTARHDLGTTARSRSAGVGTGGDRPRRGR